ncbi:hypothetical protein B566_EDAN015375 [Ephemera danica]|nr:hypothetical protein B566_EDAN015375 [Ephemera danica]
MVLMIVGCLIFGAKREFVMKHLHRLRMASYNERQELFPMYARDVENQDGDLQYFLPNAEASAIAGAEILSLSPIPSHSLSVAVSELRSYVEQALFPRGQTQPWEEGQKAEHRGKNRYLKLYAYDHTRVQLTPLKNDLNSHYINANFIDGYEKQRQYIATQGPNKMTISDFWRMICQEDVTTIVMLANLIEENKPKCEQYWPDVHKEIQYGSINIRNKEEKVFLDYTVRNFLVTNKTGMGEITRKVDKVEIHPRQLYQGMHAHSAGVGRTGTVILSHACYQMAKIENRVDCLALVGKIRSQRANLVDRVEQYELVHRILIELLVVGDTRIPKEAFQTQLAERMLLNEMSKQEAEKMENISWPPEKSRFPAITPGEHGRVMMDNEATFINAVTVDGLKMKDKFIVTQLPLPETINDFWNMVVQEQVGAIVLLNEPQPSIDTSTTPLWNEHAESTMQLEALNVTAKQCNLRGYGDLTEILLEYGEEEAAGESRTVQQRDISVLRVKGWEYGVLMHGAPEDWVNIWRDVQLHSKTNLPIVVACHDGATASGLFVAASYVFENIDETGMVDVVSAVRNVRHNRPQFIAKYEQFEFLYEIASEYLNTYEIYANSDVILRYSQV